MAAEKDVRLLNIRSYCSLVEWSTVDALRLKILMFTIVKVILIGSVNQQMKHEELRSFLSGQFVPLPLFSPQTVPTSKTTNYALRHQKDKACYIRV